MPALPARASFVWVQQYRLVFTLCLSTLAMMNLAKNILFVVILTLSLANCATLDPAAEATPVFTEKKLTADLNTLLLLQPQLDKLDGELHRFRLAGGWQTRGYFDADEMREVEALLFRFGSYHTALWGLIHSYNGLENSTARSENQARAELVSGYAMLLLASHTSFLVTEFAGDPVAIKQLNQVYYRSEIPFGTYDKARESVTASEKRWAVLREKSLYQEARNNPQSFLSKITDENTEYARLISQLPDLLDTVDQRLGAVAEIYASGIDSELVAEGQKLGQHKVLYFARSVLFKDVSRLKSPGAQVIRFSAEQQQQIYAMLQPGDLVLTYTAGYMSSVFIPGAFKHGITFIGSPQQRKSLALTPQDLPASERFQEDVLARNLQQMTLENGSQADMIEAVAEGVIFNNLGHIMDTHINRMLVLRPKFSGTEQRAYLAGIFSYLGDGYDFRFDFSDSTYQVCTEVIYRELDGKAGTRFSLTERAGHPTLSADDISNYYLESTPPAFDFVLYAEEDLASVGHDAKILVGATGAARVKELMQEQGN